MKLTVGIVGILIWMFMIIAYIKIDKKQNEILERIEYSESDTDHWRVVIPQGDTTVHLKLDSLNTYPKYIKLKFIKATESMKIHMYFPISDSTEQKIIWQ